MNVALVSTASIPTCNPITMGYGGIEALVFYEVKELQRLGHKITLFAMEGSDASFGELATGKNEFDLNRLAAEREEEFDIIHQWSHIKPRGSMSLQQKTCCSVFYTDDVGPNPFFSSHQVANAMNRPDAKVIYPGINPSPYRFFEEEREDWFLFFNRISSFKGADVALRISKNLGLKLKVAGHDGYFASDQTYVEMIKQECDGELTEYLGEVSFEDKVDLLSRAKALLFPFRWLESFSLIAVEALISGCPVICTALGGPREIVQDGRSGYLCKTIDEFENTVKHVDKIDPRNCAKRGLYFNSRRMTEEYLRSYRELLTS